MKNVVLALLCILISLFSCTNHNPNIDEQGKDELKSLEVKHQPVEEEIHFRDVQYVPIYSDIYVDEQNQKNLLAATLSIRNTSFSDSLFIAKIDYYNTDGSLVRSFIELPINLPPMATVNYVIDVKDDTGGPGANFIVDLSSRNANAVPVIQAVMIGQNGNKAFAFTTEGISVIDQIKK